MRHLVGPSGLALGIVICVGCAGGGTSANSDGGAVGGATGNAGAVGSGGTTSAAGAPSTGGAKGSGGAIGTGGVVINRDAGRGDCPERPVLTPGVWKNITPAGVTLPDHPPPYGIPVIELDPSDPCTIYACADMQGVWRTTDGGTSWNRLGNPPSSPTPSHTVEYLDSPIHVLVDPDDSKHLYATQGVRGASLGFWVSTDAGATWAWPPGYVEIAKTTTNDVTILVADPGDFRHVLLGSHSPWSTGPTGIMETTDGGQTFVRHDPAPNWSGGSLGINFLHDPALGLGDGRTWLVGSDFGGGFWRTTNSGTTWSKVADLSIVHGGQDIYYTAAGVAYVGAQPHPARSTDNGLSWQDIPGLPNASYYSVKGDGNTLYTQLANTGDNGGRGPQPYYASKESDGMTWAPYKGGAQTFSDGPFVMRFDAANRILYSANWDAGVWALRVDP